MSEFTVLGINKTMDENMVTDFFKITYQLEVFQFAMNITIRDFSFLNNVGTALGADSSVIVLDGKVDFIGNHAPVYGGVLRLTAIPFLLVRNNTSISFIKKLCYLLWRCDIYRLAVRYIDYTFGLWHCFLYFESIDIFCSKLSQCPDLRDLKVNITFSKNKAPLGAPLGGTFYAPLGGTFYGASLDSCPWAGQVNKSRPNGTILGTLLEH